MADQPGQEGLGEADLLEQTSPSIPELSPLASAADVDAGKRCQQGTL